MQNHIHSANCTNRHQTLIICKHRSLLKTESLELSNDAWRDFPQDLHALANTRTSINPAVVAV